MKKNWLLLSGLVSLIGTLSASDRTSSLQEGLELRRIAEYCKEKNFHAVKMQIHNFLSKHPHSDSNDALYAMLGDILFSENDFSSALSAYELIKRSEFRSKTAFRRVHCLHQLSRFQELMEQTRLILKDESHSEQETSTLRLQLANALFRSALSSEDQAMKTEWLQEAKEQFLLLAPTEYAQQTFIPLVHIYTFLKEYPQAVSVYQKLIEQDPKNEEEYLLQILQLQLKYDRQAAIETCAKIYQLEGKAAPQAAFNHLSLLFGEKRYRDVAHFQDKRLEYISQEHLPIAHYYIGRSLYHIGDYKYAAVSLGKYLCLKGEDNPLRVKNALLTLLYCAKETDDFDLFEQTLDKIRLHFPKDAETKKALLLYSQLCRSKGKMQEALLGLKDLLDNFSDLSQRDIILYDYALLNEHKGNWFESACAYETFINQFSSHPQCKSAWRHLLECRFNAIKESTPETLFVKKEEFITTLQQALKEEDLFSPEEFKKMRFTYAKACFENQKYQNALEELTEYVKEYPNEIDLSDAYLLMALTYAYDAKDLDLFATFAEKALSLNPTMPDADKLHLNLFNTYLSLAEKKAEEEKGEMLLKAADHLFEGFDASSKKENQLWLANFYFHKYKSSTPAQASFFLDRAIVVLEKILHVSETGNSVAQDPKEREAEAIELAELYAAKGKNLKRIALLEMLAEEYRKNPTWAWKYQRLAQFELATAYKEDRQFQKALTTYAFLIDSSAYATSYFATAAQLEKSLLEFSLLTEEQKKEHTQEVQAVCDALKDLEIKRKLFSEPCHLEAALSYIDITVSLSASEEKIQRRLELLHQAKESFSCETDPLVIEYLSSKNTFADKYALYGQYMHLITADQLSMQALLAKKNGAKDKSLALAHQALDQLALIAPDASSQYLQVRIEKIREAMEQIL